MPDKEIKPLFLIQDTYSNKPSTFGLQNFVNIRNNFDSVNVDIDLFDSMSTDAPTVKRGEDPVKTNVRKFETKSATPLYFSMETDINAEMDRIRIPGETYQNLKTPEERRAFRVAQEVMEHNSKIDNTLESMLWQSMTAGTITTKNRVGVSETIDLLKPNDHIYQVANLWSNVSTSKPINDIVTAGNKNSDDSDAASDTVCFGWEAFLAFIEHDKVSKIFDNLRIDPGNLKAEIVNNKVTYVGTLAATGMEAWVVNTHRRDFATKNKVAHIDPKKVWVGSALTPKSLLGGRVDHKDCPSMVSRYAWKYSPDNGAHDIVAIMAAEIAVDNMPNASSYITVLA
jgi:hypothetical protein